MAGGVGSRFWPLSRLNNPKQFRDILGTGKSLIQHTIDRFQNVCPVENIYVVTNKIYKHLVQEQMPELHENQILLEPIMRNTAPCIAYACYKIAEKNAKAKIVVTPSDHAIFNESEFERIIMRSLKEIASSDKLITIGITPTRPDTGYGYIQFIEGKGFLKKAKTFTEKPAIDIAIKFYESGEFVWNAGIFIWNAAAIKKAIKKHLPDMDEAFRGIRKKFFTPKEQDAVDTVYSRCRNISVDYGIMEKADNVYVVPGSFEWSDLGSWNSLYEISDKDDDLNVLEGDVLVYDSTNCIVKSASSKLIVIEGLKGYLVADCGNALIICKKDNEKQFRKFVRDVKNKMGTDYL